MRTFTTTIALILLASTAAMAQNGARGGGGRVQLKDGTILNADNYVIKLEAQVAAEYGVFELGSRENRPLLKSVHEHLRLLRRYIAHEGDEINSLYRLRKLEEFTRNFTNAFFLLRTDKDFDEILASILACKLDQETHVFPAGSTHREVGCTVGDHTYLRASWFVGGDVDEAARHLIHERASALDIPGFTRRLKTNRIELMVKGLGIAMTKFKAQLKGDRAQLSSKEVEDLKNMREAVFELFVEPSNWERYPSKVEIHANGGGLATPGTQGFVSIGSIAAACEIDPSSALVDSICLCSKLENGAIVSGSILAGGYDTTNATCYRGNSIQVLGGEIAGSFVESSLFQRDPIPTPPTTTLGAGAKLSNSRVIGFLFMGPQARLDRSLVPLPALLRLGDGAQVEKLALFRGAVPEVQVPYPADNPFDFLREIPFHAPESVQGSWPSSFGPPYVESRGSRSLSWDYGREARNPRDKKGAEMRQRFAVEVGANAVFSDGFLSSGLPATHEQKDPLRFGAQALAQGPKLEIAPGARISGGGKNFCDPMTARSRDGNNHLYGLAPGLAGSIEELRALCRWSAGNR